jgi:hypothetical protein
LRLLACALGLFVWLFAWDALADPRVALVVPDDPTEPSTRAEERLRAELMSAGYEVVTVPVDGVVDRSRLRAIAKRTTSVAAVSVELDGAELEGAVWAKDDATGQESMERVRPARATLEGAAEFAIWAAEQLRASVLAFTTEPPPETPSEPPKPIEPSTEKKTGPEREAPKPLPQQARPYALTGGISVLFGPGGVPAGFGPSMTLSWRTELWFGSLRFIGPVSSSLETTSGTVDIDQEQVLVRVGVDLGDDAGRLVPFAAVGLGAYRLGARGDAVAPFRSTSNQAWSGMMQLTGGLRLRLSELFFVACEGGVWLASTKPVVRIDGAPSAAIGRPGYVGSMGLGLSW